MFIWSQPTRVEQPGGGFIPDTSCWAAALSSWQQGMGRKMETIVSLETRFQGMKPSPLKYDRKLNRWSLDAGKFYIVAADQNVNMAWRRMRGAELIKWDLEIILNLCGYIYFVAKIAGSHDQYSHARIMYGAWNEFKVAYFIDPSPKFPGIVSWDFNRMKYYDFLIGIDQSSVPFGQDGDWENTS